MLTIFLAIGLIFAGISIAVKRKRLVSAILIGVVFFLIAFLGIIYACVGAPNGYEEPVITSMYELLPIEVENPGFTDEREVYVIAVGQVKHICVKRLDKNIPKSLETYSDNADMTYSDEYLLKVYDVVAKPSIFTIGRINYNKYEICIPEEYVLKVDY